MKKLEDELRPNAMQAFSDCIRGEFQTFELPPMKTGDAYKVTFEIDLNERN